MCAGCEGSPRDPGRQSTRFPFTDFQSTIDGLCSDNNLYVFTSYHAACSFRRPLRNTIDAVLIGYSAQRASRHVAPREPPAEQRQHLARRERATFTRESRTYGDRNHFRLLRTFCRLSGNEDICAHANLEASEVG